MGFTVLNFLAVVCAKLIPLTLIFMNAAFIYYPILRIPYAIYWAWILYDNLILKTPWKGGRPNAWFRGHAWWKAYRDYFSAKIVHEVSLEPNKPHILVCHPHGILGLSIWSNLATSIAAKDTKEAGLGDYRIVTVAVNFWTPFWREWVLGSNFIDAGRGSFRYMLSHNRNIVVVVGGASESLAARPGKSNITLMRRKGFVREALMAGAALVPVFSFGENDLFDQFDNPDGSLVRTIQQTTKKLFGFTVPFIKNPFPFPRSITTVIGSPIAVPQVGQPTQEQIDQYHSQYVEKLKELHERHKNKFPLHGNLVSELHIMD